MNTTKILLGKRIKNLRKQQNITQEQLAELINIDKRNLSNIENGHTFPSKSLDDLAVALKVSFSELFDFEHLKVDCDYMKKYITENIAEFSEDKITIIYRLMKAMK